MMCSSTSVFISSISIIFNCHCSTSFLCFDHSVCIALIKKNLFTKQPGEQADLALNHLNGNAINGHQDTSATSTDLDDRGRPRKKRDFFGTLKRRLGRSKSRAKSSERGTAGHELDNPNGELRSISFDRINSFGNRGGGRGLASNTFAGNYL